MHFRPSAFFLFSQVAFTSFSLLTILCNKRCSTLLEILLEDTDDSTSLQETCIFLFFDPLCQKDCRSGPTLPQFRCTEELLELCFQSSAVDGLSKCAVGNNSDTENARFLDTAN